MTTINDLVAADLREREALGVQRYGTPLTPETAIDALVYAYEEALDQACYLRLEIEKRRTAQGAANGGLR